MAKSNQAEVSDAMAQLNKLEAIKEIIFGQEKQDLNEKLRQLEDKVSKETDDIRSDFQKEIKALNESLSDQIKHLGETLMAQLQKQEESLKAEVSRIDHEKTNRADLGDLLIALGNQLKK
jgi:hypothetical protein